MRIIDALILLQLCYGFMFGVLSLWGYRMMYYMSERPGGRQHSVGSARIAGWPSKQVSVHMWHGKFNILGSMADAQGD